MLTVTSSQIVSTRPQVDGRSYVMERHTVSNGTEVAVEYLADAGLDVNTVMTVRAAKIQAELQAREAVELAATAYEIPMTEREFMRRFTVQERIAIRNLAKTDDVVVDFLDILSKSGGVYRGSQSTRDGLDYLVSKSLITTARKAEILA